MSTAKAEPFIFDAKLKEDRDYWIEKLSAIHSNSSLKRDFKRCPNESSRNSRIQFRIEGGSYAKLVTITGGLDLLIYAVLMAVLKLCLHKYTSERLVVVGSPSIRSKDSGVGTDNSLAIVDEVDDTITFRSFLLQVRETLAAAYSRQSYPFTRLANDLGMESSTNAHSLFGVAAVLKNIHVNMPELDLDLTFEFEKLADRIDGEVEFRSDRFHMTSILRFVRSFVLLMECALDNVDLKLSELYTPTPAEAQQILVEWNDTDAESKGERLLHRLFEAQAITNPDATALSSDNEHMSYHELNRRADQLAQYLQGIGVKAETIVGLCAERSLSMIVGLLGILKAGGAYLPIDYSYPLERLKLIIGDSRVGLVLTHGELGSIFSNLEVPTVSLDTQWKVIEERSVKEQMNAVSANNLAYVIYTSGSSGRPKGVLIDHASACYLVEAQIRGFKIGREDRVFQFAPLAFDASVSEIFTTLAAGGTLELGNPKDLYVGPFLNRELKMKAITAVTLPPSVLAETISDELPALRLVVAAGENCPAATAMRWANGRMFINAYGPTEVAVCASLMKCNDSALADPVPIGRAIDNKRVYVFDTFLNPAPIGTAGELLVGGNGLARGYLTAELTAEKFIPDPSSPGGRLYRTGDLAYYRSDGNIIFAGRLDRQAKIHGHRIEPGEIEYALSQHPGVKEVAVVARENPGGDAQLVAYVVTTEARTSVGELRTYLKSMLPEYMVPAFFMMLDALPLTRNGKVDHAKLPSVDPNQVELAAGYVAPRNDVEEELARLFSNVLGIESVSIHDNFFERGGHSLLAVQLITQIREAFQTELDVIAVFEAPTVAELAVVVAQAQKDKVESEDTSETFTGLAQSVQEGA